MIKLTELQSSTIKSAGHDPASNLLAIHFHSGHVAHYKDVPPEVANKFMQSESVGKYFHANIKGKFTHEPVVAEPAADTAQA